MNLEFVTELVLSGLSGPHSSGPGATDEVSQPLGRRKGERCDGWDLVTGTGTPECTEWGWYGCRFVPLDRPPFAPRVGKEAFYAGPLTG